MWTREKARTLAGRATSSPLPPGGGESHFTPGPKAIRWPPHHAVRLRAAAYPWFPEMRTRPGTQAGQTLPLVVVFMFTMLLFAGLVIDLGNAYRVQHALQASADAAAAGGAGQLTMTYPPSPGAATAAATRYGSQGGGVNPIPGVPAGNVSESVSVDCETQVGYSCTNGYANTVTVDETAKVPTYLLRLLGFSTITLKAHAQACSPCGGIPLDVMIVLDRTGSMGANNKMPQAKAGIMAFLSTMDPSMDNVGLAVLPPAPSVGAACTNVQSVLPRRPKRHLQPHEPRVHGRPAVERVCLERRQPEQQLAARLDGELRPAGREHRLRRGGRRRLRRAAGRRPPGRPEGHRHPLRRRRQHRAEPAAGHVALPDDPVRPGRDQRRHRQGGQGARLLDRLHGPG